MTVHLLKTVAPFYQDVADGSKQFEVRADDREPRFATGDLVVLREYSEIVAGGYTGLRVVKRIGYILRGHHVPDGLCVFGLVRCDADDLRLADIATQDIAVSK